MLKSTKSGSEQLKKSLLGLFGTYWYEALGKHEKVKHLFLNKLLLYSDLDGRGAELAKIRVAVTFDTSYTFNQLIMLALCKFTGEFSM